MERIASQWALAGLMAVVGTMAGGCGGTPKEVKSDSAPSQGTSANALASTPRDLTNVAFLDQYASTYRFRAGTPVSITPTPDGKSVLFLRSGPRNRVQDMYEFDVASGTEKVLLTAEQILGGGEEKLTAEELARRERMRQSSRGITSFGLSKDGSKLLVPLSGKVYVVERATSKITEIKSESGFPIDPKFSPDGTKVAVVRNGNVFVHDLASGSETQLTGATKATITNGLAEFVAQEEMDRFDGYWWSPDSTRFVYQETDTEGLETFTIADPVNPDKEAQTWPYPRPGKANAKVRLFVTSLVSGATAQGSGPTEIRWDHDKYEYLVSVKWPKNAPLTVVVMNREQTEMAILAAEPMTGATSTIHIEKDAAWLNIDQKVPAWLEDGSGFLWTTERDGGRALEVRAKDGAPLSLIAGRTEGFLDIAHFDGSNWIRFLGTGFDRASEPSTYIGVAGLVPRPGRAAFRGYMGDKRAGVFGIVANESGTLMVQSETTLAGDRRWVVLDNDYQPKGELKSVHETPSVSTHVSLQFVTGSSGRSYNAAIIRPHDFDATKKYPVILSVYAGPHTTVVHASSWNHLLNQWFADQGFVVVMLDGRGTPRRGREWERAIKHDLITIPLEDQVDGLQALGKANPEMDMSRVGVYGWSFGGYFSAMAAMQRPDVFKAACAGAPVCDWHDYDTCYTERYLGVPDLKGDSNPTAKRAYEVSNVLTYAAGLQVPLLLIHGTADDNVYFMHSLKMADVMFKAGRDYDFLVLPGFTHMVPDPVVTTSLYSRVARFFQRELGEPRAK
jgi:dipeptidyl-peptidase-4